MPPEEITVTFAPKLSWFLRRFNRGSADKHVSFWNPDTQNDCQHFGVDLDAGEDPVLLMIASTKSSAGWLTTKRFVWDGAEGRQQFWLNQITDVHSKSWAAPKFPATTPTSTNWAWGSNSRMTETMISGCQTFVFSMDSYPFLRILGNGDGRRKPKKA
jgi:hypothetical protein